MAQPLPRLATIIRIVEAMKISYARSLIYHLKCFHSSRAQMVEEVEVKKIDQIQKPARKPGGWKSMPYVIGNETFEKLATIGLLANFMVYLVTRYNMKQVFATNVINIWSGTTNFAPLLGAFVSDAYLGRFRTLAYSSIASLLGMTTMTLTAILPELRPPKCNHELHVPCSEPSGAQLAVLYLALGLLTVGAAGIRPCNLPFGVDQFDFTTEDGRKGIDSFFNWYYFTFTAAMMISLTLIVYIQDSVSWGLGLGIPTFLMLCSVILFFLGTRVYIHVPPGGSIFSGIAQVVVAAYRKRRLVLPPAGEQLEVLYNPPPKLSFTTKLSLTPQFSNLNKAAIIGEGEVDPDGGPINPWRLCSVQQIEELKCLVRIAPIWAAGIICFTSVVQQATFVVSQAMSMNRHLGPNFKIPPGSLAIISMLTITLWIPVYDRLLIPTARRVTKQPGGITLLQRMGVGLAISISSMVVAGLIEAKRRRSAITDPTSPISVMWLAPQLVLLGLAEAFNGIGQIEFYYKQFPEHMRSIAGSLFFCGLAGSSYLSSFVVSVVHHRTNPNWLTDDINDGKLDYFYYLIALMGLINLVYYVICASFYQYKEDAYGREDVKVVVELSGKKSDASQIMD